MWSMTNEDLCMIRAIGDGELYNFEKDRGGDRPRAPVVLLTTVIAPYFSTSESSLSPARYTDFSPCL